MSVTGGLYLTEAEAGDQAVGEHQGEEAGAVAGEDEARGRHQGPGHTDSPGAVPSDQPRSEDASYRVNSDLESEEK